MLIKKQGFSTCVELIIHPFIVHHLVQRFFFTTNILQKYDEIFEVGNGQKKFKEFQATCFVYFWFAFLNQDSTTVIKEILSEGRRCPTLLEQKALLTYKALQLVQHETRIKLFVAFSTKKNATVDDHTFVEIPCSVWLGIFQRKITIIQ